VNDSAGFFVKHAASGSQCNSATVSGQERTPDFFLEAANAFAQCRLGNMEARRRSTEMKLFGEDDERR
jgi:hypothetical protein